jgi:uncharacterized membrane protein
MPFRIEEQNKEAPAQSGAFLLRLRLWPHSSLSPRGFVWVIGLAYAFVSIPLLALLGTAALWGILPFALVTLATLWFALKRSWRDRDIAETLELTADSLHLHRRDPGGRERVWDANPYWVRVCLHATGGPVEDYVTLEGGSRVVEIGAFLTPEERRELRDVLSDALGLARVAAKS